MQIFFRIFLISASTWKVFLNIELKGLNTAKPTYELLQSLFLNKRELIDKISISSFNWEELDIIYNLDNDISTAVLTETKAIQMAINQAKKINAKAININYKLLNRKVVKTNVPARKEIIIFFLFIQTVSDVL